MTNQVPTLYGVIMRFHAYGRDLEQGLVWCDACEDLHFHSATSSGKHRVAHCRKSTKYQDSGYYVTYLDWPEAQFREVVRQLISANKKKRALTKKKGKKRS